MKNQTSPAAEQFLATPSLITTLLVIVTVNYEWKFTYQKWHESVRSKAAELRAVIGSIKFKGELGIKRLENHR